MLSLLPLIFVFVSLAVSMEEWQNRLRAQKTQERDRKKQHTQTLTTHRAAVVENEQQQKLRQTKRESVQAKQEAKQAQHNYRATTEVVEATKTKKVVKTDRINIQHYNLEKLILKSERAKKLMHIFHIKTLKYQDDRK